MLLFMKTTLTLLTILVMSISYGQPPNKLTIKKKEKVKSPYLVTFAGKESGKLNQTDMDTSSCLVAYDDYKILSFTIMYEGEDGNLNTLESTTHLLTYEMKQVISLLIRYDFLYIRRIKALPKDGGDPIYLPDMNFTILNG